MDPVRFGQFIAEERKRADLTQGELAEKLNVSTSAISKWERGLSMPEVTRFEEIARALDLSILELMECRKTDRRKDETVEKVIYETISYSYEEGKKKFFNIFLVVIICIFGFICSIAGYYHALQPPEIYYGESDLCTLDDRIIITEMIRNKMAPWEGTRLIAIRYAGDDISRKEDCLVFETDFRRVLSGGNYQPFIRKTWKWFIVKNDDQWEIKTFGEG